MMEEKRTEPKSKAGSIHSVHEAMIEAGDEIGGGAVDVGLCPEHKRPYEALCYQCKELVCPSCIMFGPKHKQHPVVEMDKGVGDLKNELYSEFEKGHLKVDYTEKVLLDIRQAILTCDQMKNKLVNSVNDSFAKLVKSLKERKSALLAEIDGYFEEERNKILENEENWKHKQELTQELLKLSNTKASEAELLKNSRFVYDAIEKINEPIKFHEMRLINSLTQNLTIPSHDVKYVEEEVKEEEGPLGSATDRDPDEPIPRGIDISLHQLLNIIKRYMTISEYKNLQYKA